MTTDADTPSAPPSGTEDGSGSFSGAGPWTFSQAIDALVAAARQAGKPSFLWLAGYAYMGLGPGWHQGWSVGSELMTNAAGMGTELSTPFIPNLFPLSNLSEAGLSSFEALGVLLLVFILLSPFLLVGFRLLAGLARLAPPRRWRAEAAGRRAPGLAQAWRAGKGITLSALGLNLLTWFMLCVCAAFILGPVLLLNQLAQGLPGIVNLGLLFVPVALFLFAYGFLLSVLFQLALQSLGHNGRGAGSAFQHAWRLARQHPRATAAAVLVDVLLQIVGLAMNWVVTMALTFTCVGIVLVPFAVLAVMGFLGTVRCAFWARAYRALGGVTAEDALPGLRAEAI